MVSAFIVGQKMLDAGIQNAKADGYTQMIIESQNNNVIACNFYRKQGAVLAKIDMYAYYQEESCRDEVQFIWHLDLNRYKLRSIFSSDLHCMTVL